MSHPLPPAWLEDDASQLPALQLLQHLGWNYLTPDEALALRGGRESQVFLTDVLANWLRTHNAIESRGRSIPFSEANIQGAIQALAEPPNDALIRASEDTYHLLRLGKSFDQVLEGGTVRSFDMGYIDWKTPANNVYHVTEEFSVTRAGRGDTYRPDIVMFINGIPFVVIECKSDPADIGQAVRQHSRNWGPNGIPSLYIPAQLLFAVATSEAKYATTGTPLEFWAPWREEGIDAAITPLLSLAIPADREAAMLALRPVAARERCRVILEHGREPTEQDRLLWALARPERLLRMARRYVVFDAGVRKVARHQQVSAVETTLARIRERDLAGRRRGGVVWHTQGSGKSLTMVYLAAALAEEMA